MNPYHNAKFALVIAEIPKNPMIPRHKTGGVEEDAWKHFLAKAPKIPEQSKTSQQLHHYIWQIDLQTDMRILCEIWLAADKWGVPVRVLFLEASPEWLQYPEHEPTWP
jgi:hypothetical protein